MIPPCNRDNQGPISDPNPGVYDNLRHFTAVTQYTGSGGFRLTASERHELLLAEPKAQAITFFYINGNELLSGKYAVQPRFLIDFGEMDLLDAAGYPKTLDLVKSRVLKDWTADAEREAEETATDSGEHQNRLKTWWRLKRRRSELLKAIAKRTRYMACVRHTKRPIFVFLRSDVRPDSALTLFAFEDDYSFGILQSDPHWLWFKERCSTIKRDWRYTSDTVYDTFVWPQTPTNAQVKAVAAAGREVRKVRERALRMIKGGLRSVYRTVDLPGANPLKDAHAALNTAVLEAYGFAPNKDILAQLLSLNLDVATKIQSAESVMAPGIPAAYPDPASLVTDDCLRPTR